MTQAKKHEWIAGIAMVLMVAAFMAAIMIFAGCAARIKTVTDLPAGVTLQQAQSWDSAVANLHKIATATSTLRQAVIALNKSGVFPDGPAYASTLNAIVKIDQLQLAASTLLRQAPQNFGAPVKAQVADYVQQISAQLSLLNTQGVTGIKNTSSQQQIAQLISEISAAVQLVLAL